MGGLFFDQVAFFDKKYQSRIKHLVAFIPKSYPD